MLLGDPQLQAQALHGALHGSVLGDVSQHDRASHGTVLGDGALHDRASHGTVLRDGALHNRALHGTVLGDGALHNCSLHGTVLGDGGLPHRAEDAALGVGAPYKIGHTSLVLWLLQVFNVFTKMGVFTEEGKGKELWE